MFDGCKRGKKVLACWCHTASSMAQRRSKAASLLLLLSLFSSSFSLLLHASRSASPSTSVAMPESSANNTVSVGKLSTVEARGGSSAGGGRGGSHGNGGRGGGAGDGSNGKAIPVIGGATIPRTTGVHRRRNAASNCCKHTLVVTITTSAFAAAILASMKWIH